MYKILYKNTVEIELRKLPQSQRKIIVKKIQALAEQPHPSGVVKLRGSTNLFRIRHADYRLIYQVNDEQLVILVVKIGHRREVYRDF